MMGLPPGSSLEFTLFRSEGAGQIQVDLSQPFVFSGDILVGVQAGFDVTLNGQSQSVSMTMRTQTTTSTLPRLPLAGLTPRRGRRSRGG
jgi:hypothetical protein